MAEAAAGGPPWLQLQADLCAATPLDGSQARALALSLGREVALVQGPPGTGGGALLV